MMQLVGDRIWPKLIHPDDSVVLIVCDEPELRTYLIVL
jgi:hypothetical protein